MVLANDPEEGDKRNLEALIEEARLVKQGETVLATALKPETWDFLDRIMLTAWRHFDADKDKKEVYVSQSQDARMPIKIIMSYCKLAFTRGQHIQQMAYDAGLLSHIIRYVDYNKSETYAVLSNMTTKNRDLAGSITKSISENIPLSQIILRDPAYYTDDPSSVPISEYIFLRNAVAAVTGTTQVKRIFDNLWSSVPMLECVLANAKLGQDNSDCDGDGLNSDDRVLRMRLISLTIEPFLQHDCLASTQKFSNNLEFKNMVNTPILREFELEKLRLMQEIWNPQGIYGKEWTSVVDHVYHQILFFCKLIQDPQCAKPTLYTDVDHFGTFCYAIKGLAIMLKALVEQLTADDGDSWRNHATIQDLLAPVLQVLSFARLQFPRPPGGRYATDDQVVTCWPPLQNFKRNCITIIANLCADNRTLQDKVRALGGIPVVLDHCQIDDMNPHIQEHATFCTRILLHDNPENQTLISSLQPLSVQDTPTMQEMDIQAELDSSGRPVMMHSIND